MEGARLQAPSLSEFNVLLLLKPQMQITATKFNEKSWTPS